jgi:hypothetical protein
VVSAGRSSRKSEEKTERFTGKCIRAAEIVVMIENRKPVVVLRLIYYYLHFNERGILDYDRFMKDGILVLNSGSGLDQCLEVNDGASDLI